MDWEPKRKLEQQYQRSIERIIRKIQTATKHATSPQQLEANINAIVHSAEFRMAAQRAASMMVTQVGKGDFTSWRHASREIGKGREIYEALRNELKNPSLASAMAASIEENASYIQSMGQDLASRVSQRAQNMAFEGKRPAELAEELWAQIPDMSYGHAKTIARTEVSKANTNLIEARSSRLNINWYIWRSSKDERVRHSHRNMDGVLVSWANPPSPEALSGDKRTYGSYHAGCIFNCRCYPEPVIDLRQVSFPARVHIGGKIQRMTLAQFEKLLEVAA